MLTPFGVQIRKLRLDKGLRLLDLANALKRTPTYLSAVETGRKPIPDGFEREIAVVMELSEQEAAELVQAGDRTRKEVKVGGLEPADRELVAAFARRIDRMPPDALANLRKLIFKMSGNEAPFFRRRRGHLVPARGAEKIWDAADTIRSVFGGNDASQFPIMDVLEFRLHLLIPGFHIDIVDRRELNGDEAQAIPASNVIMFAEDVYEDAWEGNGRARFTAAHELGHLLLHRDVVMARSSEGSPIYRDSEWQADAFAGSLLMSRRHATLYTVPHEMARECRVTLSAAEVMWGKYASKGIVQPWEDADDWEF